MKVKRTNVTYGQLNQAMSLLGVSRRLIKNNPPANAYEHPERGLIIILPASSESTRVYGHHLVAVRTLLDNFGIAEPTVFDAELQKAG